MNCCARQEVKRTADEYRAFIDWLLLGVVAIQFATWVSTSKGKDRPLIQVFAVSQRFRNKVIDSAELQVLLVGLVGRDQYLVSTPPGLLIYHSRTGSLLALNMNLFVNNFGLYAQFLSMECTRTPDPSLPVH